MKEGIELEFVDLYSDMYRSRTPLLLDNQKKTDQVLDYQMQLKSADWVVFLYQTVLGTMPGHMKSYLDAVMTPGVAYSGNQKGETYLDEKKATVYIFEPKSRMESQLFNANREDFFWNRNVFRTTGLKGEVKQYFSTEKLDGNKIDNILHSLHTLVQNFQLARQG